MADILKETACTCMDELALRVKVVQGQEEVPQAAFEERFGKPAAWIAVEKVLPAVPHRRLDEALVMSPLPFYGKHPDGSPDMLVSGMSRIRLSYSVIYLKLIAAKVAVIALEHFEGTILAITSSFTGFSGVQQPTYKLWCGHTVGYGRAKPSTLIQSLAYRGFDTYWSRRGRQCLLDSSYQR